MNAPEKLGRGKKPRNGNTAKAIEYIRKQGNARTDEIAEHLGIDRGAVQPLLHSYVKSGDLITCLVTVPGKKHQLTQYRIGSGIPVGSGKGWKGEKFAINPGRPARLGASLTGKEIAAAKGKPAVKPVTYPKAPDCDYTSDDQKVIHTEHVSAPAAHPQPAVGENTGSAPVEKEASLGGAHREPSASKAKAPAKAKGADDIRLAIGDDARLVITLGSEPESILISAEQTRRLGEFLVGTRGVWSAA